MWNFELMPVYCIAILNFRYDETEELAKFRRDVCLKDQDGDVFFDKLHFKFLQMPLFTKQEHELATHFDKWVYFLKHLESLDHIPTILNEPIFQKGFEIAELAHLSAKQFDAYQKSLLEYWDVENVSETAFEDGLNKGIVKGLAQGLVQGRIEGKLEGKIEGQREAQQAMAKTMLAEGLGVELIAKITGLSSSEIEQL
ncbi:Rpn family recombination-promoting nuclease/putative transposase [Methylocucumis oryzae]|uniref:Rpn family recombination-promoting nuclease/putative transposase n=1 Tax=Methylocucumis oryzae TaxID=1632867 RepID=UPI0023BAE811|nr:Rpn family recombination-promoting nuclease/putative transposase [Methylocucumis oryzae]